MKLLLITFVVLMLASCRQELKPSDVFHFPKTNFTIGYNGVDKIAVYIEESLFSAGKGKFECSAIVSSGISRETGIEFIGKSRCGGDVYIIITSMSDQVKNQVDFVLFMGQPIEIKNDLMTVKIEVKPKFYPP